MFLGDLSAGGNNQDMRLIYMSLEREEGERESMEGLASSSARNPSLLQETGIGEPPSRQFTVPTHHQGQDNPWLTSAPFERFLPFTRAEKKCSDAMG